MKLQTDNITFSDWREILLQTSFSISDTEKITCTTFSDWWSTCNSGIKLLKFAGKDDSITRQQLVYVACQVARSVLHLISESEDRPRIAIETAEAWCLGKATDDEVKAATAAAVAYADYISTTNATDITNAVYTAITAVNAAIVDIYYTGAYAADTVYYAAYSFSFDTSDITIATVQAKLANIVRQHLPIPTQLDHDMKQLLKLKAFW